MEKIRGIEIENAQFFIESQCSLLWFEGDLLTLYWDFYQSIYLVKWCDFDDKYHRWMFVKVNNNEVISYFRGQTTLRRLFKSQKYCLLLDGMIDEVGKVILSDMNDIPEDYFPMENSYCNPKFYTDEGQLLVENTLRDWENNNGYCNFSTKLLPNEALEMLDKTIERTSGKLPKFDWVK